jgi:hypothetical protein
MSVEMDTYVPAVDDSLIPRWLSELKKLGMDCEIYPGVSLVSHSGFLPFKIRIHDSAHKELNGVDFLTGFEYYLDDFNLEAELEQQAPEPSWVGRLFGKKQQRQPYATVELDEKLKQCRKLLTFSWGSADFFELRMASVSSAILAEITGGVSSYPADGIWYDGPNTVAEMLAEAQAYENSLKGRDIKVHRFEEWL